MKNFKQNESERQREDPYLNYNSILFRHVMHSLDKPYDDDLTNKSLSDSMSKAERQN